MGDLLRSFEKKYPVAYFILAKIIPIIYEVGLVVYLTVSNSLKYSKYARRDTYVLDIYNGSWYMYKQNQTRAAECPHSAAFDYDITSIYTSIVNNRDKYMTILFQSFFWVSCGLAILISIVSVSLKVHRLRNSDLSTETSKNKCGKIFYFVYKQLLRKYTFVVSTYFISIFDFSQLCLEHHSPASLFSLQYTGITYGTVVLGAPLILIDMCLMIRKSNKCSYQCCWQKFKNFNICTKLCLICIFPNPVVAVFLFGTYIYIFSLIEMGSRIQSILIGCNMIICITEE
jgi:hypothetical protein